jgi:hypothetical protein
MTKNPHQAQITLETALAEVILGYERTADRTVVGIAVTRSAAGLMIEAVTIPQ